MLMSIYDFMYSSSVSVIGGAVHIFYTGVLGMHTKGTKLLPNVCMVPNESDTLDLVSQDTFSSAIQVASFINGQGNAIHYFMAKQ